MGLFVCVCVCVCVCVSCWKLGGTYRLENWEKKKILNCIKYEHKGYSGRKWTWWVSSNPGQGSLHFILG